MVAAALRQAFLQSDVEASHQTRRHVADQLRPRWPKLAAFMDESEHDVLAYMAFTPHPDPASLTEKNTALSGAHRLEQPSLVRLVKREWPQLRPFSRHSRENTRVLRLGGWGARIRT